MLFRSEVLNTSSDDESLNHLTRSKLRGKAIGQLLVGMDCDDFSQFTVGLPSAVALL